MGWFSNLFGKKRLDNDPQYDSIEQENTSPVGVTISTSFSSHYVESYLAKGAKVSHVKLGGYKSQSGGYVNWNRYRVHGIKAETGRKNTRYYDAKTEDEALQMAKANGLIDPFEIVLVPHDAPTERQISYLQSWNAPLPEGATKHDVSTILSRLEDSDIVVSRKRVSDDLEVRYIFCVPGPSEGLAVFADNHGLRFSKYIGRSALINQIVNEFSIRDKAAFYSYCVLCDKNSSEIGNLDDSKHKERLYQLADIVANDSALTKSLTERHFTDYLQPHKGTKIYKSVSTFFNI